MAPACQLLVTEGRGWRTHRLAQNDAPELVNFARHRGAHQEALMGFRDAPRPGEDRADVVGRVAVREDEVRLVNDNVPDVIKLESL